jgi:HEAT repeat protein
MRRVAIAALVGCALLFQAAPSAAQFKFKGKLPGLKKGKTEKKSASQFVPQITEIGGKDLDEWIKEIHASDPSARVNAIRTVLLFGPERAQKAVPALIAELRKHGFSNPLDLGVRTNATLALAGILSSVKDPEPKQVTDAVTLLKRMLTDTQDIVRYRAAQALAQLGPEAKEAVPALRTAIRDPLNWETREAVATALGRVAVPPPPAKGKKIKLTLAERVELVQVVVDLSSRAKLDSSAQVRLAALRSLSVLGPWIRAANSPDAEKVMDKDIGYAAAKDPSKSVQIWANFTLMVVRDKVEPKRVAHVGDLLAKCKQPADRAQAAQALGLMGDKAKSQVPRLVDGLEDPDPGVAAASMVALAQMGDVGLEPIGSALAHGKTAAVRAGAAQALGALGAKAKGYVPALTQALADKDKGVAAASLLALAQIGERGLEPVSKLLLESKEVSVRIQAAQALGAAGPKAKSQVSTLVQALGDSDKDVVAMSAWALAQMGKDAEVAVPRLQQLAKDMSNQEALRQMLTAAIDVIQGRSESKKELKKPKTATR